MPRSLSRRTALKGAGSSSIYLLSGCLGSGSDSGEFPDEEILLIIPFSPGGGFDSYARLVANHIELPMRVENITEAAGDVAKQRVYTAEPDGYTLMISSLSVYPTRQIAEDPPYDLADMTYFPQVVDETAALGGAPGLVNDWDQIVEFVNDGEIRFAGSPGGHTAFIYGATGYLGDLWSPDKVFENMVTLGGTAEIMAGIQRGDADAVAGTVSSAKQYVEAGDYEFWLALTNTSASDVPIIPDGTPTLQTEDIPRAAEIEAVTSQARFFVGPPDIPESRRLLIEDAFIDVLESESFRQAAEDAGRPVNVLSGSETRAKALDTLEGISEIPFMEQMSGTSS